MTLALLTLVPWATQQKIALIKEQNCSEFADVNAPYIEAKVENFFIT